MITTTQLNFSYHDTPILRDISLSIAGQQLAGLIGPNGAGKSTFLKIIAGLLPPHSGSISLAGKHLPDYSRKSLARLTGLVPQHFQAAFDFTVYEIVAMGRYPYQSSFRSERGEDRQVIRRAMEETEVWQFRDRPFSELSGGEQQRVVLASALAQEPRILLLDEPTSALDIKHQLRFYEILKRLPQERSMTILTVTHDINLAARFCERILVMKEGRIVADGPPETVIEKSLLEQVYEVPVEVLIHPRSQTPLIVLG
ncbi:MAG: heme ABC transporter ATP-binding protein [Calditrichaeota bacterium]|nr:heme ABC transporter ATP-binding protein [Calditrichota bacterium]